jgi:hypothetical protein
MTALTITPPTPATRGSRGRARRARDRGLGGVLRTFMSMAGSHAICWRVVMNQSSNSPGGSEPPASSVETPAGSQQRMTLFQYRSAWPYDRPRSSRRITVARCRQDCRVKGFVFDPSTKAAALRLSQLFAKCTFYDQSAGANLANTSTFSHGQSGPNRRKAISCGGGGRLWPPPARP